MTSVTIFGENGKKTTVHASPTTHVNQILHQACQNLGITENIASLRLRHGRKLVDLSLPLRLTGLLPGAKLEIFKMDVERTARPVTVALQVGSTGSRKMVQTCDSSLSLWQVLRSFECAGLTLLPAVNGKVSIPSVVVMNQEINCLEALASTTLQSLGISQGNCLLRLVFRPTQLTLVQALDILCSHEPVCPPQTSIEHSTEPKPLEKSPEKPLEKNVQETETLSSQPPSAKPPPRDYTVFKPPPSPAGTDLPGAPDLPDSFYTLSDDEIRHFQALAASQTRRLIDRPLMLRSNREQMARDNILKLHPHTKIRFRFIDHAVVEAVFATDEHVEDLYRFLFGLFGLLDGTQLALFVGIPPKHLDPTSHQQLWELHMHPASIVNVIWSAAMGKPETLAALKNHSGSFCNDSLPSTSQAQTSRPDKPKTAATPFWLKLFKK